MMPLAQLLARARRTRTGVRRVARYYASVANAGPLGGLALALCLAVCGGPSRGGVAAAATAAALLLTAFPAVWQQAAWAAPVGAYLLLAPHAGGPVASALLRALPTVGALLTAAVMVGAPIPPYPRLVGRFHTVGTVSDVWSYTTPAGVVRALPVTIWYPSSLEPPPPRGRAMLWTPGVGGAADAAWFRRLMDAYGAVLDLPWFLRGTLTTHLTHVTVPAVYGAPLSRERARWPAVLYSHGLFGYRSSSSFVCLSLAASGFVVVGLEHAGCAVVASGHEDGLVSPKLFSLFRRHFWREPLGRQRGVYEAHLHTRHADVLAAARRLVALGGRVPDAGVSGKLPARDRRRVVVEEDAPAAATVAAAGGRAGLTVSLPSPPTAPTAPLGGGGVDSCIAPVAAAAVLPLGVGAVAGEVAAILGGRLDGDRLGVLGHSYGGGTAVACVSTHGAQLPTGGGGGGGANSDAFGSPRLPPPRRSLSVGHPSPLPSPHTQQSHAVLPRRSPVTASAGGAADPPTTSAAAGTTTSSGSGSGNGGEPVLRAAVAMDPWLYPLPPRYTVGSDIFSGLPDLSGEAAEAVLARYDDGDDDLLLRRMAASTAEGCTSSPTLFLSAQGWHLARQQLPYARAVAARHAFSHIHVLPAATHLNFADLPLLVAPWVLRCTRNVGNADPYTCAVTVARLTALFFGAHLGDGAAPAPGAAAAAAATVEAAAAPALVTTTSSPARNVRQQPTATVQSPPLRHHPPADSDAASSIVSSVLSDMSGGSSSGGDCGGDAATPTVAGAGDVTAATVGTTAALAQAGTAASTFGALTSMLTAAPQALQLGRGRVAGGGGGGAGRTLVDDMVFYKDDPFKGALLASPDVLRLLSAHVRAAASFKVPREATNNE